MPVGSAARAAHGGAVTHPGMAGLGVRGGTSCSSPTVGNVGRLGLLRLVAVDSQLCVVSLVESFHIPLCTVN